MKTSTIIFGLALAVLVNAPSANAQRMPSGDMKNDGLPMGAGAVRNKGQKSNVEDLVDKDLSVSTEGITSKEIIGEGISLYLSNFEMKKDDMGIDFCVFDTVINNDMKNQIASIDTVLKWAAPDKKINSDVYTMTFSLKAIPAGKEVIKRHDPVYLWCTTLQNNIPTIDTYDCQMLGLEKKSEKSALGSEKNSYIPKNDDCKSIIKYKKEVAKKETFDEIYNDALGKLNGNKSF
jgi:hypothetical protein